jgi:hypothetical protein
MDEGKHGPTNCQAGIPCRPGSTALIALRASVPVALLSYPSFAALFFTVTPGCAFMNIVLLIFDFIFCFLDVQSF